MDYEQLTGITVKSIDEEQRRITGVATTIAPDRDDDVVEPMGAKFALPIPFLWQHDRNQPIGEVISATVTEKGIEVEVQIARIEEPGRLKGRIDEAWQAIKSGLVKGLSIGFKGLDAERLKGSKGIRYKTWDWRELSAVTLPANLAAGITSIKQISEADEAKETPVGESAVNKTSFVKLNPTSGIGEKIMQVDKQIESIKSTIADKHKAIAQIMGEAVEKGATPDEDQEKSIAAMESEIVILQKNLTRLESIQDASEKAAKSATIVKGSTVDEGVKSAEGAATVRPNLAKGIGFAQYARAKMAAAIEAKKGNYISPAAMAKQLGFNDDVVQFTEKATLGTTTNAGFAAPLVDENTFAGEFIELLRAASIFSKLTGYRSVPFNTKIKGQLTGGTASWVGEGDAKPLTNPTFGQVNIGEHKLAAITVYTQELMRRADPAVDALVRDDLIAASSELVDTTFIGAQAQTDDIPIGILNGVTAVPSTGTTAAAYEADIMALLESFVEANMSADNSYLLMSETRAMQIALLRDALGNTYFPGMSFNGATRNLLGIPVVTSQRVGDKIIMVKMSEILVAQDGGVDVSYSDQATLVDGATTHHLWQENKFAIRVEKFITWAKRRPIAAAFIDYAAGGE